MRYIVALALLCLVGCGGGAADPTLATATSTTITVYCTNASPVPQDIYTHGLADINWQLSIQFRPRYAINATLVDGTGTPSATISQTLPSTDESYATSDAAYVSYTVAEQVNPDGHEEMRCISHEVINLLMLRTGKALPNLSITDCCGGDSYSPTGTGPQNLADFAYPSFCVEGGQAPYDVCGILTAPLTPPPGGALIYPANASKEETTHAP